MPRPSPAIKQRIENLRIHLQRENPLLLDAVKGFQALDKTAYRLGLLNREQSFATRVSWWPLISVLGTFSSGKSSFINYYLGQPLQASGNQAVDDKFTVLCFHDDATPRTLPGLALDADARFPFYQISQDIEEVATGEGERVNAYLQLKTCASEKLRGKILIDSPGFDADAQRNATLRITDHIIELADLVLVFFDARHPEPGAMQDTLEHLVAKPIKRADASKFLYILNQIDTAAREDNPEEVFAAWQRALGQKGLTAGRFYRIYNPDAANPIDDPERRARFESKRDADLAEIEGRMQQVETERAYRIVGALESTAKAFEGDYVPRLRDAKQRWQRYTRWLSGAVAGMLLVGMLWWLWGRADSGAPEDATGGGIGLWLLAGAIAAVAIAAHVAISNLVAQRVAARLNKRAGEQTTQAFRKNAKPWNVFRTATPIGWGRRSKREIAKVLSDTDRFVQALNDRFANPSGSSRAAAGGDDASSNGV